eukprot:640251-Pleurochrysis_carterae.AAC.1
MSQPAGMPSARVPPTHHPRGGSRDGSVFQASLRSVPRTKATLGVLSSYTSATANASRPQILLI